MNEYTVSIDGDNIIVSGDNFEFTLPLDVLFRILTEVLKRLKP
jgi:hypothetical protein